MSVTLPTDLSIGRRDLGRVSLNVAAAGPQDGPVVVLLHGFPETWWSWRHQLLALVDAGFRVLAPDLRGSGHSDRRGPFDLSTQAADIAALIATLPAGKAHVVGHDWGGTTAWWLARHHPERVERVTCVNACLPERLMDALIARPNATQILKSWYFYLFLFPGLADRLLTLNHAKALPLLMRSAAVDKTHFSDAELLPFCDAAVLPGAAKAMLGSYRDNAALTLRDVLAGRPPGGPRLPIHAPATLLWGDADPALDFDVLCLGMEALVPRLVVRRFTDVGHFAHEERPELINPALLASLT